MLDKWRDVDYHIKDRLRDGMAEGKRPGRIRLTQEQYAVLLTGIVVPKPIALDRFEVVGSNAQDARLLAVPIVIDNSVETPQVEWEEEEAGG